MLCEVSNSWVLFSYKVSHDVGVQTTARGVRKLEGENLGGTWVAQSVKCLTLGFGSGHDLRVVGSSSTLGSVWIEFGSRIHGGTHLRSCDFLQQNLAA